MKYQIKFIKLHGSDQWVQTTKIYDNYEEVQEGARMLKNLMNNLRVICIEQWNTDGEKSQVILTREEI